MPCIDQALVPSVHMDARGDRGAVATVFGILLSGGVLLGLMALVIDVGQLYVERGELQTGADAAALAVARACATNTPDCRDLPAVTALAQRYLDDNASDGVSKLDVFCGRLRSRRSTARPRTST